MYSHKDDETPSDKPKYIRDILKAFLREGAKHSMETQVYINE